MPSHVHFSSRIKSIKKIAIATIFPNSKVSPDELIQTFFVGNPVVRNHTANGLAKLVTYELLKIIDKETITTQLVSGGTDGQYFNLGVPDEFRRLLNLNKIYFYWDAAHKVMLAEKDIRTEKIGNTENDQFPFLVKLIETIKDFLSNVNYGKKYEDLIQTSEKYPNEKFYKLHSISTTRFAAYMHSVLLALLNGLKVIVESLNECSKDEDDDATSLLRRICNVKFITLLVGMVDVYDIVAKLCGYLQKVNIFIWERQQMIKKSISTMKAMVHDVHNDTQSSKYWPTINAYWPLLKRNELIKDLPVSEFDRGYYALRSQQPVTGESPFIKTRKELQEVLETFQI